MKITNNIYEVINPLFLLNTKESYDWSITRRKWGFKHQISKENKSKSVSRKYLEALNRISQACKMAAKFRNLQNTILQPKADFVAILL